MDEYLRERYKAAGRGGLAQPSRPIHRPAPIQPHQPATTAENDIPAARQVTAERPAQPKRRFGLVKILSVLLILGLAAIGGGYYYLKYVKAPTPIAQNLVKSAGYPIYYPSILPGNYKYVAGSASNQSGLFTYKIADGSDGVVVSEQTKPTTNFNPSGLPSFKSITVSGGSAVIGISSGVMTVIYLTPTTLINLTAVNDISRGDMISIAQNLSAIKKQAGLL